MPLLSGHEEVPPKHQHFLDRIVRTRGWISPAFQVLLHTPDAAERAAHIGAFLLYESALADATRAIVGAMVARELDSDYLWSVWSAAAHAARVDTRLIAAIEQDQAPAVVGGKERALIEFCTQLLRGNHHITETTYQAAVTQYGVAELVQISVFLGYCVMMGLLANAFGVSPPADTTRPAL